MQKKRIYVAYTGGTLGMQPSPQGYQPVAGYLPKALQQLPQLQHSAIPDYQLQEYAPLLDSSDMQPKHWQQMANDIHARYDDYDGFVVLHGTDTMAYSAAALHYLLMGLSKPVIVTGSQIPLCEPNSDAPRNIRNAFYAAAYSPFAQVTLLFHHGLYAADSVSKVDAQQLQAFASINTEPLWQCDHTDWVFPARPSASLPSERLALGQVVEHRIAVLTLYPGVDIAWLCEQLAKPWYAVVLRTFGSGNAPQQPALLTALRDAHERGVILINRSQCWQGVENMTGYAGAHVLAQCGVQSAAGKPLEAIIAGLYCGQWSGR
ncbi:MAG: asparaginase [Bacterioplanes sp.]|nr:asparaginase [Bacterioplanes sp.]